MKHFTLILVSLLICFTAYSQQRIFHKTEKDSLLLKVSQEYKDLGLEEGLKSFEAKNTLRSFQSRESFRLQRLFALHAYQDGIDFSSWGPGEMLMVTYLIGKDKKVDHCFYEVRKLVMKKGMYSSSFDSISTSKELAVEQILTKLLEKPVQSINVDYPYRFNFSISPQAMHAKKPSPDKISTIEDAQKTTQPDTVTELNFSSLMLTLVPEVIYRFKNLKELDLSKNYLENFSVDTRKLKKLQMIDLSTNSLGDGSLRFSRNRKIKVLNLIYNEFTNIPKDVTKNRRLEDLLLASNMAVNLDQYDFKRMKRLKNLNLYDNQIKELPPRIKRLKNLEVLDLYHNHLKFLPKEIGDLKQLSTLAVSNNQFWKLPDEIGKLTKLKKLYAHHNKLDKLPVLPQELKMLDIGYNQFREFPASLSSLRKLEELDFSFNQIIEIPVGLLKIPNLKTVFLGSNEFIKDREKAAGLDSLVSELDKKSVVTKK
jgi:Leucine-rich repeat (LRR) protein